MTIFLILLPYGAFSLLMLTASATMSLLAGAAICLAVVARDVFRGRSIKILGAGSAIWFAALAAYVGLMDSSLSSSAVRLMVDVGVFAISLGSLILRRPFTMQYAREMVDAETANQPGFVRASYIITAAWIAALVLMIIGNVTMMVVPGLPLWSGLLVAFAARSSAVYFSKWYPEHQRTRFGATGSSAGAV